jgi:hypothetical protein
MPDMTTPTAFVFINNTLRSMAPLTADEADEWLTLHAPDRRVARPADADVENFSRTDSQLTCWRLSDAAPEQIRHGSFGPIVWATDGTTRVATQRDMDTLPVGADLTADEESEIEE